MNLIDQVDWGAILKYLYGSLLLVVLIFAIDWALGTYHKRYHERKRDADMRKYGLKPFNDQFLS